MEDLPGNSPSKYHRLLNRKPLHEGNIEVLSYISSIWEDDHIERLENNQWKYLWCDVKFKGINANKSLAHVIMHIKRCIASIDKAHLSIYKDLQLIKSSKKDILHIMIKG